MNKFILLCTLLLALACKERESKNNTTPKTKTVAPISNESVFNIEGIYKIDTDSAETAYCNIEISIKKVNKEYHYELKTEKRKLSGVVTLKHNEQNNGYYITLEGIEWSEYEGSLDKEGEAKEDSLELPVGIQGVLSNNEITIQNYGNSMNYYVQLSDCDEKYIILEKK
ncbi:MAG: hypothetical protein QM535_14830 [Limnohabitans sp.]|nr:hypothetical protein [Limnohabitans sp.]